MAQARRTSLAQETVDILRLVEILGGGQGRLPQQTPKMMVAVD